MATFLKSFAGKRVLVTGHTGFKGAWLSEWLLGLGSEVWGFSLPPATRPALFTQLGLSRRLHHTTGDLRDASVLTKLVAASKPEYVFHLAAQPIVRTAHAHPADTWSTNVMGTIHLLEALRQLKGPCAALVVTTDKVYGEGVRAHTEEHPLGAADPYGASKAAVELAVSAWRRAFFPVIGGARVPKVALATARAGNVIGGGDWAKDRLLPDCIRGLASQRPIMIRNPHAVRPWQHVLDPLAGYLMLAAQMRQALTAKDRSRLEELSGAFNFGPAAADHRSVAELVEKAIEHWPGKWERARSRGAVPENPVLRLDARKAARVLGWRPRWGFERSVEKTMTWYSRASTPRKALELTRGQIEAYASP